ncbi:PA14 domain-containing protein [Corallococcus carmarthensis]|uniref:PA14 domain-containing protein n=1 Tax=Corallococcus carmarthensis TaxID=2316728 RepID=A0A3A8K0E2_9BACT|nr:PA14 domain-containing protein [Corallococcus carmarthensis]RKH00936.1 hypothetical protein D7X32_22075 [Corallococcus carmarthensis]
MEQALNGANCRPTVPLEEQPNAPMGPDMVCSGPWAYRDECFKLSNTSACPGDGYYDKVCQVDKTCDYTIRATVIYSDQRSKGQNEARTYCDYSNKPPCVDSASSTYLESCQLRAEQLIDELKTRKLEGTQVSLEDPKFKLYIVSAVPAGNRILGTPRTTQSSGSGWSSSVTVTPWTEACTITIGNVVTQGLHGQHPECGKQDVLCPDPSRPKYTYCRDPSHGMEPDPATCDAEPGKGLKYSAPGISLADLKENFELEADIRSGSYPNRPRCLTAEDTAFSAVDTKYTLLVDQLDAPVPAGVDGPALKFELINALKLLFELHADDASFNKTDRAGGFATRKDRVVSLFLSQSDANHVFREDPTVDFAWGEGAPFASMSPNTFSVRWTGFVDAPQAGTYLFQEQGNESLRLWVDGQLVLDRFSYQGAPWFQASLPLSAGRHAVKLEYQDGYGPAEVHLKWQPPGETAIKVIPSANLFTPDQQRQGLLGEYFDSENFTSDTCASNAGLPELEASCPEASNVQAMLARCQRLLDANVSKAAAGSLASVCTPTSQWISELDASRCDVPAYRAAFRDINTRLLLKGLPEMTTTLGSEARIQELREKLAAIHHWYWGVRASFPSNSPPPAELMTEASQVMKAFWMGAWIKDDLGLTAATDADAKIVRTKILTDGFVADRQVLLAAFGESDPPLTGAPLLYLLEDSLRGLNERLLEVSRLHDMGCRFVPCATRSTKTSELWNILAHLDDAQAFNQSLSSAVHVSADWTSVFSELSGSHGAFRTAVEDALGLQAGAYTADALYTHPVSGSAMGLTAMLRDAKARSTGYAANGLFTAQDDHTLKVGLNRQKQEDILAQLNATLQQLDGSVTAYNAGRLAAVQGLLGQMQSQNGQASLDNKLLILGEQVKTLNRDLNGLRTSQAVEEARMGDFMDGFEALFPVIAEQGQTLLKAEYSLAVHNKGRKGADAADVIGLAERNPNGQGGVFKVSPSVGSQLVVQVGGAWSPTCALGLTGGPNGSLVKVRNGQSPIMTGPEGFSVVEAAGTYTAKSVETLDSRGNFSNATNTDSFCGGFNLSIYGIGLGGVNSCMSSETGTTWNRTWNQTDSSGSNKTSTFSVARGLRSPKAPFPDEPVGSLLLVEMVRGQTNRPNVRSVRVLQSPSKAVLVTAESDFYVVVNDAAIEATGETAQCASWVGDSQLDVRIAQLSPLTNEATLVTTAMVAGLEQVKQVGRSYAAQGRLLPNQINSLRTQAFNEVYQRCNCTSLNAYPENLRTLFGTWVEKALTDVEREVELISIERQLRQAALENHALATERESTEGQSRLLALVPVWALRNLDGTFMRAQLEALDEVMGQWLAPTIRLMHPETLTNFTSSERSLLEALTAIDPTSTNTDISLLAQAAKDAARAVETRLAATRIIGPSSQVLDVIVSIPKPGVTPSTIYRKVDPALAKSVWDDILANRNPTLTLTPEHIYSLSGGQKLLPCNQLTPIIRTMVLYGILPSGTPYDPYTLPVGMTPTMRFPTASSLYQYDFNTASYLTPAVQMMFGNLQDPLGLPATKLENYLNASVVAQGLSPFTTYHVNLDAFREMYVPPSPNTINPNSPLAKIQELLVVFRVETKQEASSIKPPGVARCQ